MTTSGPLTAGSGANDSSIGGSFGNWASPGNITANDATFADASPGSMAGGASHYLVASNFGFAIASDQIIDGIKVQFEVKNNAGTTIDNAVRIVKGGVIGSTDKSDATPWPGSETLRTYGSDSDLWGESWTPADINDSSFGCALSCVNSGGDSQGSVDYVRITVDHHSPFIGGGGGKFAKGAIMTGLVNEGLVQ